jgi:hypothetical protein
MVKITNLFKRKQSKNTKEQGVLPPVSQPSILGNKAHYVPNIGNAIQELNQQQDFNESQLQEKIENLYIAFQENTVTESIDINDFESFREAFMAYCEREELNIENEANQIYNSLKNSNFEPLNVVFLTDKLNEILAFRPQPEISQKVHSTEDETINPIKKSFELLGYSEIDLDIYEIALGEYKDQYLEGIFKEYEVIDFAGHLLEQLENAGDFDKLVEDTKIALDPILQEVQSRQVVNRSVARATQHPPTSDHIADRLIELLDLSEFAERLSLDQIREAIVETFQDYVTPNLESDEIASEIVEIIKTGSPELYLPEIEVLRRNLKDNLEKPIYQRQPLKGIEPVLPKYDSTLRQTLSMTPVVGGGLQQPTGQTSEEKKVRFATEEEKDENLYNKKYFYSIINYLELSKDEKDKILKLSYPDRADAIIKTAEDLSLGRNESKVSLKSINTALKSIKEGCPAFKPTLMGYVHNLKKVDLNAFGKTQIVKKTPPVAVACGDGATEKGLNAVKGFYSGKRT